MRLIQIKREILPPVEEYHKLAQITTYELLTSIPEEQHMNIFISDDIIPKLEKIISKNLPIKH